jgi:hypothetical protein
VYSNSKAWVILLLSICAKASDLAYKYLFRLRAVEGVLKLLTDAALFNLISSSAACNVLKQTHRSYFMNKFSLTKKPLLIRNQFQEVLLTTCSLVGLLIPLSNLLINAWSIPELCYFSFKPFSSRAL